MSVCFVAAIVLVVECFKERHRRLADSTVVSVKDDGRVHGLLLPLPPNGIDGIDAFYLLNDYRSLLFGNQQQIDPILAVFGDEKG